MDRREKIMKRLSIMNEGLQAWITDRAQAQSPYNVYSLNHVFWTRGWLSGYAKECN
jgi:hypothetical protein